MNRENFLGAVNFASKAISSHPSSPVLECVQITSDGKTGTATGTNLDLFCRYRFPCDIALNICVRAARLRAILDSISDEAITIECKDSDMHIRAGQKNFTVPLFKDLEHFPKWEEVEGTDFPIPAEEINRISHFAHSDRNQGVKNCVWLSAGHVVACDGRVIAYEKADVSAECLLPLSAAKLLAGLEGQMRGGAGKFTASGEDWGVTGKLYDGKIIAWQKMIPATTRQYPIPDSFREVLTTAVRLYVDQDKSFNYRFTLKDGNFQCGDYTDVTDMDGEIDLHTNANDILEAIRRAPGDVMMHLGADDLGPTVIKSGGYTVAVAQIRR